MRLRKGHNKVVWHIPPSASFSAQAAKTGGEVWEMIRVCRSHRSNPLAVFSFPSTPFVVSVCNTVSSCIENTVSWKAPWRLRRWSPVRPREYFCFVVGLRHTKKRAGGS